MTTIILALSLLASATDDYTSAKAACERDGRPLLVLTCAGWCEPCKRIHDWIPILRGRGRLVVLDVDLDTQLAASLTDIGPIPRLAIYHRVKGQWMRRIRVGIDEIKEEVFPSELR